MDRFICLDIIRKGILHVQQDAIRHDFLLGPTHLVEPVGAIRLQIDILWFSLETTRCVSGPRPSFSAQTGSHAAAIDSDPEWLSTQSAS